MYQDLNDKNSYTNKRFLELSHCRPDNVYRRINAEMTGMRAKYRVLLVDHLDVIDNEVFVTIMLQPSKANIAIDFLLDRVNEQYCFAKNPRKPNDVNHIELENMVTRDEIIRALQTKGFWEEDTYLTFRIEIIA